MLEIEIKTFEQNLADLLKTNPEKFVLIKDNTIVDTFVAKEDALKCGYQKFGNDAFLVEQILPNQVPLNFANNFLVV